MHSFVASARPWLAAGLLAALLLVAAPAPAASAVPTTSAVPVTSAGTVAAADTGSLTTSVRDAATGAPVRACVNLVPLDRDRYTGVTLGGTQLGRHSGCSGEQGDIVVEGVEPGRYQLFARPYDQQLHGLQWVGRFGGTGQRQHAAVVRVAAGATATAPQIRLDPPGSVTGTLTDSVTAAPAARVHVTVVPLVPHPKYTPDEPATDNAGRYTVTGLGPYRWPLQFFGSPFYAVQWSGGVGNVRRAQTVQVRAGQTVTFDQTLRAATTISGKVIIDELGNYSPLLAFNVVTGDLVGVEYPGDTYQLLVVPGQVVKLRCHCGHGPGKWHPTGTAFSDAAPVPVGRNPIVIDFDLTGTG
ncbi:hypothetical protein [Solwaraspora sp. WMMA2101]|uniref:hypothetical protein n=1 Tax=Solwaraspora sp. WMMA2101 TaxID=3404124 RepID=UPI003B94E8CB